MKALELNASGWMLPNPEDNQKTGTVCTIVAYLYGCRVMSASALHNTYVQYGLVMWILDKVGKGAGPYLPNQQHEAQSPIIFMIKSF